MFNPDPVLVTLLQATVNSGASDLHITVGRPPTARRDGTLVSFENVKILDNDDTTRMVMSLLSTDQRDELEHGNLPPRSPLVLRCIDDALNADGAPLGLIHVVD